MLLHISAISFLSFILTLDASAGADKEHLAVSSPCTMELPRGRIKGVLRLFAIPNDEDQSLSEFYAQVLSSLQRYLDLQQTDPLMPLRHTGKVHRRLFSSGKLAFFISGDLVHFSRFLAKPLQPAEIYYNAFIPLEPLRNDSAVTKHVEISLNKLHVERIVSSKIVEKKKLPSLIELAAEAHLSRLQENLYYYYEIASKYYKRSIEREAKESEKQSDYNELRQEYQGRKKRMTRAVLFMKNNLLRPVKKTIELVKNKPSNQIVPVAY